MYYNNMTITHQDHIYRIRPRDISFKKNQINLFETTGLFLLNFVRLKSFLKITTSNNSGFLGFLPDYISLLINNLF